MIIENTLDLEEVCRRFATYPYITVDTEFIREKTYYPDLCLIQLASRDEAVCVDPLAPDMDLSPLFELLQNPQVVKVFHAAHQDIEIFLHLSGKIPTPVFDTQIGAMVCGFAENAAYSQLVHSICGVTLDKSMRCTNWAKRPLNPEQIQYALYDVTYLRDVYEYICAQMEKSGRFTWVREELASLTDKSSYEPTPEQILERLHCPMKKAINIHIYQQLYLWREKRAQLKNRPRRFLIKDELLHELALIHPQTAAQLSAMRGITPHFEKCEMAQEILTVINQAMQDDLKNIKPPKPSKPMQPSEKNLIEILKLLLNIISSQIKTAPSLIAHAEDLLHFIRAEETPLNTGWRYEVFGEKAQKICRGEMSIRYNPKKKKTEVIENK